MKIAVFAYSRQGCRVARRVMEHFEKEEVRAFTMERFGEDGFEPICRPSVPFYGPIFHWAEALVFIGSCGIAVREIAPHVRDKRTDPAVIAIDELGRFAVPLLSGHIGGANAMALDLARLLGATPVITTATDINNRISVDTWAARNGYVIPNIHRAKIVSARILEQDVPLRSDFPVLTAYPNGVVPGDSGEVGICISYKKEEPFIETLRLIPPALHLGIGCRKGATAESIREAVEAVLARHNIDKRAIACAASIDLKANEQGLLDFCWENGWPISFYSAEELSRVRGDFTPSDFVESVTGVDNVCERAALTGAKELIVKKTAIGGVTIAIAAENVEVRFG
jgi:cobalt-precorrin 5A hydrolase